MKKREKGCDGAVYKDLLDPRTTKRRLQAMVDAALTVEDYARVHDRVVEAGKEQPSCRAGLRAGLADRAHGAEEGIRSLLGYHLEGLNELRDAGALGRMAEEATRIFEEHEWDWKRLLDGVVERGGGDVGVEPEALRRVAERAKELDLALTPGKKGAVGVEMAEMGGERRRILMRGEPRPGDLARVSPKQLLGGPGVAASMPLVVARDCHHRDSRFVLDHPEVVDFYGSNVAGLAYARETAYLHARTMEELGPSAFRGEDPVTAVAATLIIIGVIVAGVGVALVASGDPRGWGLIFLGGIIIGGGICVALLACGTVGILISLHIIV